MTPEEKQAYEWALNQKFESVSARYARTLAKFIERDVAALTAERDALRVERAKAVKDLTQIVKSWRDYAREDYCTITNPEMGNGLKRAANHLERYINEARRNLGATE